MLRARKTSGAHVVRPFAAGVVRALMWLLADAQFVDDGAVALHVLFLQVVEKPAAAADHLQQTAAAVMILRVGLEVLGKVGDAVREECDLHFWRSGIDVMDSIRGDELGFLLFGGRQIRVSLRLKPL